MFPSSPAHSNPVLGQNEKRNLTHQLLHPLVARLQHRELCALFNVFTTLGDQRCKSRTFAWEHQAAWLPRNVYKAGT